MTKITHPDLIEKLKAMEVLDLLYCLVEAKAGRHIDLLGKLPGKVVIEAETALERLIAYSNLVDKES